MEAILTIFIFIMLYFTVVGIMKINTLIRIKYSISIYDIKKMSALLFCGWIIVEACFNITEWGLDNSVVIVVITGIIILYILYRNIKESNLLAGVWITLYQLIISVFIVTIIMLLISIFSKEKENYKGKSSN